jgi:cysteine desulfurase / selenocysteine lyase
MRVVISTLEHHSNIVPWQMACERSGATLKVIPMHPDGSLDLAAYRALLNERTRIVAVTQVSNALGTVNPVAEMIRDAKAVGAVTLLDGAQAVSHFSVDVRALDCDFYAFSGHKLFGPTGIGVLYGRKSLLEAMPPWLGGGEMIETVSFERSTWNRLALQV